MFLTHWDKSLEEMKRNDPAEAMLNSLRKINALVQNYKNLPRLANYRFKELNNIK